MFNTKNKNNRATTSESFIASKGYYLRNIICFKKMVMISKFTKGHETDLKYLAY